VQFVQVLSNLRVCERMYSGVLDKLHGMRHGSHVVCVGNLGCARKCLMQFLQVWSELRMYERVYIGSWTRCVGRDTAAA
jgi:hypothetical protein